MKSPIILKGRAFPWNEPNPHGETVNERGEVNWAAAAFADPGCMSCPGCKVYLWDEGEEVKCPDCGCQFETPNGKWQRERRAER